MDTSLPGAPAITPGSGRIARYLAAGATGTALYYFSLVLLVEALELRVMTATGVSFILVVAANYVLQRTWTFRSQVAHSRAILSFIAMSVAGFGINIVVMSTGVAAGIHYLLVQILANCLVVAWNYFFMTHIFR